MHAHACAMNNSMRCSMHACVQAAGARGVLHATSRAHAGGDRAGRRQQQQQGLRRGWPPARPRMVLSGVCFVAATLVPHVHCPAGARDACRHTTAAAAPARRPLRPTRQSGCSCRLRHTWAAPRPNPRPRPRPPRPARPEGRVAARVPVDSTHWLQYAERQAGFPPARWRRPTEPNRPPAACPRTARGSHRTPGLRRRSAGRLMARVARSPIQQHSASRPPAHPGHRPRPSAVQLRLRRPGIVARCAAGRDESRGGRLGFACATCMPRLRAASRHMRGSHAEQLQTHSAAGRSRGRGG